MREISFRFYSANHRQTSRYFGEKAFKRDAHPLNKLYMYTAGK